MSNVAKFIGVVAITGVAAFVIKYALAQGVSDQALIKQTLDTAVKASRDGQPGGVLDKLSFHVKLNGTDYSGSQRNIADYIKKSQPDITFQNTKPVVTGDEATMISDADMKIDFLGRKLDRHIEKIKLVFHREDDREWLIIPTKTWKLAEVQVPETALANIMDVG